jgi:hypothetical protein
VTQILTYRLPEADRVAQAPALRIARVDPVPRLMHLEYASEDAFMDMLNAE